MSDRLRKVLHAFSALADLGEELAETSDYEEMVAAALHVVLGALGARRGAVAEFDQEAALLRFVAARGTGAADGVRFSPEMFAPPAHADAPNGNGHADAPPLDTSRVEELIGASVRHLPVELVSALVVRDELVGAILVGGKASDEPFTEEDRELVRALGRHVGIGLHNHRLLREVERRAGENRQLYEDLRALYKDTVRAFAAAIDSKDKYTQGHSERVGKYSEIIARELGWTDEEVEGIALAGYLHDIGKLVVDREIINAPYKIDAKQSSQLNRHPTTGYEILSPINHPYADIPRAARYHHERVDGRGYPEGLTGDQIPLCAKIVTLADSFDAMTTDRPYKRRRAFEEVVADFRRNTGRQFDPAVVAAFCRALLKEVRGETRPRQIIRLLGKDYLEGEPAEPLLAELLAELESGAFVAAG
jgi:response regulator RpfG family c-di-GMP phosphodiesterase